jgi:hypothetical protein
VDGYSHNDHKKRDLQVSKKGSKICKGKRHEPNMGGKKGVDQGDSIINV